MQQGRKVLLYARVAYVILCSSVLKVRHNECTHGDEKPPPPIREGRVYRGKEGVYERVQGRSPWGGGGGKPPLTDQNFFIIGICALLCHPNTEFFQVLEMK